MENKLTLTRLSVVSTFFFYNPILKSNALQENIEIARSPALKAVPAQTPEFKNIHPRYVSSVLKSEK